MLMTLLETACVYPKQSQSHKQTKNGLVPGLHKNLTKRPSGRCTFREAINKEAQMLYNVQVGGQFSSGRNSRSMVLLDFCTTAAGGVSSGKVNPILQDAKAELEQREPTHSLLSESCFAPTWGAFEILENEKAVRKMRCVSK